jgi:hypothetical protein
MILMSRTVKVPGGLLIYVCAREGKEETHRRNGWEKKQENSR